MKVFVTGATGMLGNVLVNKLANDNSIDEIKILYRDEMKIDVLLNNTPNSYKINPIRGSLDTLDVDLSGIDIIIHCASIRIKPFSEEYLEEIYKLNIDGSKNLLKLARLYNVNKFIYLSSQSVYGMNNIEFTEESILSPNSVYAKSKLISEALTTMYFSDKKWMIFRLSRLIGKSLFANEDNFITYRVPKKILNEEEIELFGNIDSKYNVIDVDDVSEAILKAIKTKNDSEKWNQTYNICQNNSISIEKVFSYFKEWSLLNGYNYQTNVVNKESNSNSIYISNEKFRKNFDWAPTISIKDSIFHMMDSYKKAQ